jgi:hypothetical protein
MIEFKNTLYLPGGSNLFSHSSILSEGYSAQSSSKGTVFYNQERRESIQARLERGWDAGHDVQACGEEEKGFPSQVYGCTLA